MPERSDRWPLVGRDPTLDRCRDALRSGRGVVIAGPAGVGKTRIARELADELEPDRPVLRVAAGSLGIPVSALDAAAEGSTPPVVVVDDAHGLDTDASRVLLQWVAGGDVVLLATIRTGELTPEAVTRLWKDEHVDRVDLEDLTRTDVDAVLDRVLDGPIESTTRVQLWELTQGTPLTLRELVRSALDAGTLHDRNGVWRLTTAPTSVRLDELVTTRLDALPDDVRHVVDLVALGEPVPFGPLIDDMGVDTLRAAERSGLVEVVLDGRRREVRCVHPIFGDVARRALPESSAAQLAGRLDAYLEPTPLRRGDDIVRSVVWRLRAGGRVVSDEMLLAARRALYDDQQLLAIDLASRAVDEDDQAAVILSEAYTGRGDHQRAAQVLRGAVVEGSGEAALLVALQRADVLFWGLGDAAAAIETLATAEQAHEEATEREELRAMQAVLLSNLGRTEEALRLAEPIVARPARGRAFVTAAAAATAGRALGGRATAARELADAAFQARTDLGDQLALIDAGLFVVFGAMAAHEEGDLELSEAVARFAYDTCVSEGIRAGQAWCATALGRTGLTRGRLTDAERWFTEATGLFAATHQAGPQRWSIAGALMAAALRGDRGRCEEWIDAMDAVPEHPAAMMGPEVERARAWADHAVGRADDAVERLRRAHDDAMAAGSISLAGAALHDLVRLDQTVAPETWEPIMSCDGPLAAARVRFGQAVAAGDAARLLEVADSFAVIGADLHAAEASIRAAELLERSGDERRATRCRRLAADAQRRTGEEWFVTLDRPAGLVPMTAREIEIAERAASGMTSREIGDELSISARTVDNHLQRVYDKLGVRSRRELGPALAAR